MAKNEEITLKNTKAEILEALNEALKREKNMTDAGIFMQNVIGYQSKGEVYEDHWNDYFADRMCYPVAAF